MNITSFDITFSYAVLFADLLTGLTMFLGHPNFNELGAIVLILLAPLMIFISARNSGGVIQAGASWLIKTHHKTPFFS